MNTYFIKTFGCQMNTSDSERIASFLEMQKLKPAKDITEADIVIFNTCGVRQMAENRAYGQIHNLRKNNPKIRIVLTGCLANRADVQRRLKDKVNLFFPISDFVLFKNFIIENYLENSAHTNNVLTKESIAYLAIKPKFNNSHQAFVPIMTGCNNFCSYCVVPYARGREISRPEKEILDEIKALLKNGCVSVTLLGQNVNSYEGKLQNSKNGKLNFSGLLKKIDAIPGKFWIHFFSSHPKDMSDELIETIAQCQKVCEIVHLPIQSGSDEILEKMNRKYTAGHYLNLTRKIKKAFKKHKPQSIFALTTDIIVGFPGETRKQLLLSAEIMEKSSYDMVYFGQFSPRPGTVAWNMKDNVSQIEKERREKYLNNILAKTALTKNKKYLGKKIEVLIEKSKARPLNSQDSIPSYIYFGKTRTLKNVMIHAVEKDLVGKIIIAKITAATAWNLEGTIVQA